MRTNVGWLLLSLAGCQFYEFRQVEPFTVSQYEQRVVFASRRLKPNVMLLVDNSGSMKVAANPNDPACPTRCGESGQSPCPMGCATRVTELKAAMNATLSANATVARFGLTVFPQVDQGDSCRAPVAVNEVFPIEHATDDATGTELVATASAINTRLQNLTPVGGTPTSAALDFVGSQPGLNADDGRMDLVLLLTDGVPNCNPSNAAQTCSCQAANNCSAAQVQACACTQPACPPSGNLCSLGCLDEDASVAAVRGLKSRGIRTVVVGFGTELAFGVGPSVLKAMADEGGFARECPNGRDDECGVGACDVSTHRCVQSFYSASNRTELEDALRRIWDSVGIEPCHFALEAQPDDTSTLAVLVDEQTVAPGDATWTWDAASNVVEFKGALCDRLTNSTVNRPVNLQFRIVHRL